MALKGFSHLFIHLLSHSCIHSFSHSFIHQTHIVDLLCAEHCFYQDFGEGFFGEMTFEQREICMEHGRDHADGGSHM